MTPAPGMPMLSNDIPALGFGTYPLRGDVAGPAPLRMALEIGLRHIDTAQMYGNEADVGSSAPLLWRSARPGFTSSPRSILPTSVSRDLRLLSNDPWTTWVAQADLLLIHWPPPDDDFDATIERLVMEEEKEGHVSAQHWRQQLHARHDAPRTGHSQGCNHREPGGVSSAARPEGKFSKREARGLGITLTAYSPLARGKAMQPACHSSHRGWHMAGLPSEIVLRWIIQQGVAAIPMTTKRENALSNLNALVFELPEQHMAAISALGTREGRTINPSWMKGRWGLGAVAVKPLAATSAFVHRALPPVGDEKISTSTGPR